MTADAQERSIVSALDRRSPRVRVTLGVVGVLVLALLVL